LDRIVALDVVLANGTQIHATATAYPDVFYAMRGAGDSFGIVTYFYLATESAPSSVVFFNADLSTALADIHIVTSGFQKLQNFVLTSPLLTPNITIGVYTDSTGSLSISGWCIGCDPQIVINTLVPAMLSGLPYTDLEASSSDWLDSLQVLADPSPLTQPLGSTYNLHDTFYAKSLVVHNADPLSIAAIKSFFSYVIANTGKSSFYSIINLYGGPNSQINAPSVSSSAYSDRDALWVFQNYGYTPSDNPPYDNSITPYVDGLNDAVTNAQPNGNFTAYLNYVDPDLTAMSAAELYYGSETYNRLLKIKTAIDPGAVFWNPQSIGNSPILS
jgi:hypothetical protein